jgi:hypothetical protein
METSRPYMPGYGILPADQGEGLLPFAWAEERLRDARNYWLGTVGPGGSPHLMAVWGVWLNREFVFSTGRKSRKARNLMNDPRCVVTPETAAEAVVVHGRAREVSFNDQFVDTYRRKYDFDVSTMADEPLFAVSPETIIGIVEVEERFAATATRWTFL